MTGQTRHVALLHPPSHRPWPMRRLRRGARAGAVTISRAEYVSLRCAARLAETLAELIHEALRGKG